MYPSQVHQGGTPPWVPLLPSDLAGGGYPCQGGTPPQVPPIRPGWGYPCQRGTPIRPGQGGTLPQVPPYQTWLGGGLPLLEGTQPQVSSPPPVRPGWGLPHLRYPPPGLAGGTPAGGTPPQVPLPPSDLAGGYPTSGNRWST